MSDVCLASASSTGSKVTGPSTGCSSPGNEPPAFVLPPLLVLLSVLVLL
uniref:Uncharacterized protein n=1 Tax=Seriola lalandi dorsalis TaxID=1841481 RepID=A0A3B4WY91_SERLL